MFGGSPTNPPAEMPSLQFTYNGKLVKDLSEDELRQACMYLATRLRDYELDKERALLHISGLQNAIRNW